jgi:membrane fusion protein (multidrug efflux system)
MTPWGHAVLSAARRDRPIRRRASLTGTACLAALLAACGAKPEPPGNPGPAESRANAGPTPAKADAAPPAPGSWVTARRGKLVRHVPAIGNFRARQSTRLGGQVSGRVVEVFVDIGDRVKKDQPLVRLDPVTFQLEVEQRKADQEAARVAAEDAKLHFDRMKHLWEKPAGQEPSVPRKQFDDAKARLDGAVARVKRSDADLRLAEERLRETVIRAPFDGVITARLVDVGEPVMSMPITYVVEIKEVDVLDLEFSLPQELLESVRPGTPVDFEADGAPGGPGRGTIAIVYPALDEATRTFRCRVRIENKDGKLRSGLLARVRVAVGESVEALLVPRAALATAASGWEVRVAGAGGAPKPRPVTVDETNETEAVVREGLQPGDRVWVPAADTKGAPQ